MLEPTAPDPVFDPTEQDPSVEATVPNHTLDPTADVEKPPV